MKPLVGSSGTKSIGYMSLSDMGTLSGVMGVDIDAPLELPVECDVEISDSPSALSNSCMGCTGLERGLRCCVSKMLCEAEGRARTYRGVVSMMSSPRDGE